MSYVAVPAREQLGRIAVPARRNLGSLARPRRALGFSFNASVTTPGIVDTIGQGVNQGTNMVNQGISTVNQAATAANQFVQAATQAGNQVIQTGQQIATGHWRTNPNTFTNEWVNPDGSVSAGPPAAPTGPGPGYASGVASALQSAAAGARYAAAERAKAIAVCHQQSLTFADLGNGKLGCRPPQSASERLAVYRGQCASHGGAWGSFGGCYRNGQQIDLKTGLPVPGAVPGADAPMMSEGPPGGGTLPASSGAPAAAPPANNTMLYVAGGLAALAVVGYFVMTKK